MVPIPLEYGCKEWQSLDDLYTEAWIKGDQMGRYGGNSLQDLSHFRYTTTHFPSLPDLQLRNAYTFFRSYAPAVNNSLLDRLSDARAIWMGDLLVVKHSDDNKHTMSDITASDIALVDLIIKRCVKNSGNYQILNCCRQLTMTDCDNWWSKWMAPRFPCDSADDSE